MGRAGSSRVVCCALVVAVATTACTTKVVRETVAKPEYVVRRQEAGVSFETRRVEVSRTPDGDPVYEERRVPVPRYRWVRVPAGERYVTYARRERRGAGALLLAGGLLLLALIIVGVAASGD